MKQLTQEETLNIEPGMRELVKSRGWQDWLTLVQSMKVELLERAAYTAVGDDLANLRGQLIALDMLVRLPNVLISAGDDIRKGVDEIEKARRAARAKMNLPMRGGEVSQ